MPSEVFRLSWTRGQDIRWIIKNRTLRELFFWLWNAAPYYLWLNLSSSGRRERDFDRRHGVDTESPVPCWQHDNPVNRQFASEYLPTKPRMFIDIIERLTICRSDFTFIDMGCGKGRALMLADSCGFEKIIGVEFSPALCEIAKENLRTQKINARVVCADAGEYEFPSRPLVIFMCNPFHGLPMQRMVTNLEASIESAPRPVFVLYQNPYHREHLDNCNSLRVFTEKKGAFVIYRSTCA